MTYFIVDNFKAGVDTRRPAFAAEAGTLSQGINVHLTRGGDIETAKAFVEDTTLPAGTFGLAGVDDTIYVFGSGLDPGTLPDGYAFMQLEHESALDMTGVLDVEVFDGQAYAIAQYSDGSIRHFYNGAIISGVNGTAARTVGSKMYRVDGSNLRFSTIDDPTDNAGTGAGFVNIANHSSGSEALVGIEVYYESLLVMARNGLQIWHVESDDTNNARIQTFRGIGLAAARAASATMDGDTQLLTDQGIKAVRPKDSSGRSKLDDTSYPIDTDLTAYLKTLDATTLSRAIMLIEPEDGRMWTIVGERIYVLSVFPSAGVKAWTEYRPGFSISDAAVVNRRIYVRSGDTVYLYGGEDGTDYDHDQDVTVRLPYANLRAPATFKGYHGLDVGAEGQWEVYTAMEPDDFDSIALDAVISGQTYDKPQIPTIGNSPFVSIEMRRVAGTGYGRICSVGFHYSVDEAA